MRTQDTIRTLNRLIQTCRDGEELCRICSDAVYSSGLRNLLHYRSEEWGRQGDELQALVLLLGGVPATSGTLGAQLVGARVALQAAIFGPSDLPVLQQWQSAQEHALERYDVALQGYLPQRIRRTVSTQADRVLERIQQMESLLGQYALDTHTVSRV